MTEQIKSLCALDGASGNETQVANYLKQIFKQKGYPYTQDALGNLFVHKSGTGSQKSALMVCAHMDEVALMITQIDKDGTLCFDCVGGIDNKILPGKLVRVNGHVGTIGVVPTHLLVGDAKNNAVKVSDMRIDLGAFSDTQASQLARVGDMAYFTTPPTDFGDGLLLCKAADDRVGCAILLKLLDQTFDRDLDLVFTTQEEVGCRGAAVASFFLAPEQCVVIECTTAADNLGLPSDKWVCTLGGGAVVGYMDRGTVYDRQMVTTALQVAAKQNIAIQLKRGVFGGNDASAVHKSGAGVKTLAISVPCRNLHGPCLVLSKADIQSCFDLVCALVPTL